VRRAVIAAVGTAVGLALLLGYKAGTPAKLQKVTLGTTPPATTVPAGSPSNAAGTATYTGQLVDYLYGDIEVAVTIDGKRISNVSVVQNDATDDQSQMIDSEAVPVLEQEAVSAQGLNFDVVSGATYTSDAFAQSLQSALQKKAK
jgi:uncharacterized protein with FMN-binding domain